MSRPIAAKRSSPLRHATVATGCALRVSELPAATPTRSVPKSKAKNDCGEDTARNGR